MTWALAPSPTSFTHYLCSGSLYFSPAGLLGGPPDMSGTFPLSGFCTYCSLPSEEDAAPWTQSGPYSRVTSSMRPSQKPYPQWHPCHVPAFPSTALSFNGTGLHLALPNGRDTWLKRTRSSERGQWKKIIPRRQVKYVMQQRESSRCPQNSESIWTNLCMRLGMKKPFSTSSPRALYAL